MVDSGEHVEIDGVSIIVGVDCSSTVLSCMSSKIVLDTVVFSSGGDTSSLINTTLMCVDGEGSVGRFSSLSLLNGVSSVGKLLLVKKGSVQMSDLLVSPSIASSDGLVSVVGGSFSLVNLALPPISFISTPFVLSSFDACSFTNLTTKQIQTPTLITAEYGEDLIILSCSFGGVSTSLNENQVNEDDDTDNLCSWETGLIKINDTPTMIEQTRFSHLPQGALHVNGSVVSLFNTVFIANSANDATFPSMSRNMRCLSGEVEIENEKSGNEESESLWISSEDCVVKKGSGVTVAGLFVPWLDVSLTRSVMHKNKSVSIDLVGSMLIPCSLFLLICEVGSSSSLEGFRVELTPTLFGWTNESSISVSLSSSELAQLNPKFGWNGTLVFGDGFQTSWFVVKASESDERKALMKQAMKWMIPLIAGCVVALLVILIVVVILRRRSSKSKEKELLLKQDQTEMNDLPPDKIEFVDDMLNPHLTTPVAAVSDAPFEHADQSEQNPKQQQTFNLPLEISKVEPVGIERKDTLYNRLHSSNKKPIVKFMTAQQIVQALSRLSKTNTHIALFSRFSSHSVLFDKDGHVNLDLTSVPSTPQSLAHTTLAPSLTQAAVSTQRSVGSGAEKQGEGFELLRWRAPEATAETGEPTKEFDARRAVVFSLGLVLFEIETGAVPHGEIDALNASRQMKSGILPRMELVKDCELKELIDPPQTRF
ncbi:hypothetical protein BLNAU_20398 [Blattamonas nauphoetae]|uniref:Protein kinase domain-containing protein n=1 Tax=Blattamonas nauphoetae TaxID=2049346 RepID=A0ABQ9WYW9_9EUKA|nr:hypothetical protein BLNAU_20398 [Blattamonas nauphoetae]